jgi:hypothetical protein
VSGADPSNHVGPAFTASPAAYGHLPSGTPANASGLRVEVGIDHLSAGAAIWGWRRTAGKWPAVRVLASWRWQDVPLTEEECVVYAYQAIVAYAIEQGIQLP